MAKTEWHILSTRPLPAALIKKRRAQQVFIDEISFIETTPVIDELHCGTNTDELFQKPIVAVFTSMNAVTAVAALPHDLINWTIYSIGHTTAALITQLFQIPIAGTAADAAALADVIIQDGIKEVYFFCGNMRREELPEKLRKREHFGRQKLLCTKQKRYRMSFPKSTMLFYFTVPAQCTVFFR